MSGIYDENYYGSVNYTDYLQRKDRYVRLASDINGLLKSLCLDKGPVLDFGCAVGFCIQAFEDLGYQDVEGVEISEWAIEQCHKKGLFVNDRLHPRDYGITLVLDVLEHMTEDEITEWIETLKSNVIVFRMPIVAESGEDYVLEVSRRDPTHTIRWTQEEWTEWFSYHGYNVFAIDLPTIYTSDGVFAGIATPIQ